ncbi:molybdopterin molybdotransferase MoeA [Terriglobus sp.]|uniref:molybdopterin molybdotransferase MoeA n=1 Tax=Terriglobus sp. TaxID=1889013 RepID=UPI003B001C10
MPEQADPQLLSCAEALAVIQAAYAGLPQPAAETVALDDALGRVLAEPIYADRDQPPFPRSTRDGFAVRTGDLATGHALNIVGAIRAGEQWNGPTMQPGEAIEIMTGAPVPEGADAVLMVEHTSREADTLRPDRTLKPGENIVPQGAEARSGQILLQPGVRIGPAEIALLASVGQPHLAVYVKPVVAILSTGDELVAVDETPGPHQIRNSNAHALAALVRQNGGEPRILPVAADTREALEHAVEGARGAAMLILSGGVSAGKYDLVEPVLASRGAEFLFTGVLMQPGKPAVFGRIPLYATPPSAGTAEFARPAAISAATAADPFNNIVISTEAGQLHRPAQWRNPHLPPTTQWIFGLPGNPVSTQVTAMLFALPLLRALGGETDPQPAFAAAELSEPVAVRPGLTRFLPARLSATLGGTTVKPTGWQGSGDLHSNARANCYLVLPPEAEHLPTGTIVQVLLR